MSYILLFCTRNVSAASFKSRTPSGEACSSSQNFFVSAPREVSGLLSETGDSVRGEEWGLLASFHDKGCVSERLTDWLWGTGGAQASPGGPTASTGPIHLQFSLYLLGGSGRQCARRSVVGHTPLGIYHSAHDILSRNKTTLVYLRCAIHVDTKVHWRLTETGDSGQRWGRGGPRCRLAGSEGISSCLVLATSPKRHSPVAGAVSLRRGRVETNVVLR